MVDTQVIHSTFNRIEEALDLRFQGENALFISKDDLERAKEALYKGEYQNFFPLGSKVGMPVMNQLIFKNPWLINNKTLNNTEFKKRLRNALNEGNIKSYMPLLKRIVTDQIFSTIAFKKFCEEYYYKNIEIKECQSIYEDTLTYKPQIRAICFKRYIVSSEIDDELKIREINRFFESDYEIFHAVKDSTFLNDVVKNMANKRNIADWILENKYQQNMDRVWLNAFISLQKDAYDATVQYIQHHMVLFDAFDENKWLFKTVLPQLFIQVQKDEILIDHYIQNLASLYRNYNSNKIKALFFDMLSPSRFKNKEIVLKIVDEFEQIGVPEKYQKRIDELRGEKTKNEGFESAESIFVEITNGRHDFTQVGTLNYIAYQLLKTDYKVIQELYNDYSFTDEVVKVLSYFIAKIILGKKRDISEILPFSLNDEYLKQISAYIDEYYIDTFKTREFLNQVGEHSILAKFTRR